MCGLKLQSALLVVMSTCASAQISLVSVTPCGLQTFPSAPCIIPATGAGHLIIVGFQEDAGSSNVTVTSMTDNAGNAYAEAGAARSVDTAIGTVADIWYARNSIAGATTLTITPDAVASGGALIWEFSG